jgi:hypothetical protein
MKGIPKLEGCSIATSFFALILITSTFTIQIKVADAGGKSPYASGYDHGCDDADISDRDNRYINQPEKGPSFHTDEFMRGYNAGYDACSVGSPDGNSYRDGYEKGYEDGLDHPMNREIRDGDSGHSQQYREGYLEGFMDGCLEVEGNNRDICNSAMDR